MPDYVRVGPPYGQVNELLRGNFIGSINGASADVVRYGTPWLADGWQPVPSNINPGSAQASWSIRDQTFGTDASGIYIQIGGGGQAVWTIYNATTMPPSAVIARATVVLPYAATTMFVFEMIAGATFAAFPVVPEVLPGPGGADLVASAQGTVLGSFVPISGSQPVYEMSRAYGQTLASISTSAAADEAAFLASYQYKTIQIRTVGSVASGAQLMIFSLKLAGLPMAAFASNSGAPASAAIAQASSLVGTYFDSYNRAIYTGDLYMSRVARYPAMMQWDGNQPDAQAYEIGSAMVAGQVEWGSDLVQQNFAQTQLTPGDPLSFERIPNRVMKFPYINRDNSLNPFLFARNLERTLKPGNVVDVIPEGLVASTFVTRFDIVEGRALYTEDIRYSRAGLARGTLEVTAQPYGRSASYVAVQAIKVGGVQASPFYVIGDVPAPAYITHLNVSGPIASGPSNTQNIPVISFMGIITPADKVASYYPLLLNASTQAGVVAASIPNGFRTAGSQIFLPMSNSGLSNGANALINQFQAGAFTQRTRVFAVVGNATAATIPIQFGVSIGDNTGSATVLSNIGYIPPLYTLASEMMQLAYVDLGEIRVPNNTIGQASTNQWYLNAVTGPSSNATAGVFDSVLLFPVADPRTWFGIVASRAQATINSRLLWTASSTLHGVGISVLGGTQMQIDSMAKAMPIDIGGNVQGKPPFVYPGMNHTFFVPIGISGNASKQRAFSSASTNDQMTINYYPRYIFVGGR